MMALTGLSTIRSSSAPRTSAMPCGGVTSFPAVCRISVVGNSLLMMTASNAAAIVPTRYIATIGRICDVWLTRRFAIADATSTSTRTGATALSADTNRLPSNIADEAAVVETWERMTPATMPIAI